MYSFTQLYVTFCDSVDCSPPGSSVNEIFQARILEWVAISYSKRSSWHGDLTWISCIAGIVFTHWARGKPLRVSMHGDYQWCSWWMPHHCPLWSFGSLEAITAFLASSTSLVQLHFPRWGWKSVLPSLRESEQLHYFSAHCKIQLWPLHLLHQEERIRTWENHYKKQQLLSSVLLYTHMDTSVLSSSSISLNRKKREKGQNL